MCNKGYRLINLIVCCKWHAYQPCFLFQIFTSLKNSTEQTTVFQTWPLKSRGIWQHVNIENCSPTCQRVVITGLRWTHDNSPLSGIHENTCYLLKVYGAFRGNIDSVKIAIVLHLMSFSLADVNRIYTSVDLKTSLSQGDWLTTTFKIIPCHRFV